MLPGPSAPVVVPFGGAEHDWAALELAAWTCAATSAPLKLLGAAGQSEDHARVSRLLGDAGLLVQQYAGLGRAAGGRARARGSGRRHRGGPGLW